MGGVPWPNGAKCAMAITFDLDADSILHLKHPDTAHKLIASQSQLRFGPLVAVPRILETYRRFGITQTFFVPGWCAERYPDTIEQMLKGGHEVAHHGYLHESPNKRTRDEEKYWLQRGIEALEKVTGVRPRGWRAPLYDFSPNSADLLIEEGFLYDASLMGDEVPYIVKTKKGEFIELPTDWPLDDAIHYMFNIDLGVMMQMQSPERAMEIYMAEFEAAYDQGGLWVGAWHPWISGRRARWARAEKMIEELLERGGVWFASMEEIASHVRKCIEDGSYRPRIDTLPIYTGRIPELPADAKGEGI